MRQAGKKFRLQGSISMAANLLVRDHISFYLCDRSLLKLLGQQILQFTWMICTYSSSKLQYASCCCCCHLGRWCWCFCWWWCWCGRPWWCSPRGWSCILLLGFPVYIYIYIYYLYITFSVATDFFPGVRSGTVHSKVMSYLSSFSCPKKTRLRIEIIELQRLFIE